MAQAINRYRADLRDFRFLFFEQFDLPAVLGKEPYAEWSSDECNMVLDEVYRFVCDVTGPLNGTGDAQGCRIEDGRVITPDGFKEAWDKLWEAGWRTVASPSRWGGQGAPHMIGSFVEEMLCGANASFTMYTGLTLTAAELIMEFGTEAQKQKYVPKMMSGEWTGTMCITEPHAGSDVGAASSTATRNDDGTYNIRGTKIFISAGDNDLGTNVVHLVLARIEGAEPGTKGLSLFLVPRVRIEEDGSLGELNDVEVPSIEHKMGINGSATCVMQFGDEDGCIGEVVGGVEHQGIRQMFHMMNAARIGVGVQGLAVASAAYLSALEYTRERKQGASIKQLKDANAPRVPILEHPNIRRDLLAMKARVEGIRALVMKLSNHGDRLRATRGKDDASEVYHKGQVDLLTPLVKADRDRRCIRGIEPRDSGLRRARLPQGPPGRAILPRREDLPDLRGHELHPIDGFGQSQARSGGRRQHAGVPDGHPELHHRQQGQPRSSWQGSLISRPRTKRSLRP